MAAKAKPFTGAAIKSRMRREAGGRGARIVQKVLSLVKITERGKGENGKIKPLLHWELV